MVSTTHGESKPIDCPIGREAFDFDPELAEAFNKLTPGRKKSYVINLNSAKKPETRVARIAKFREKILSGKGAMER
ncbi:MAG: YdeI/OmpD-associated family protein [Deltaproteobacteria bacterium]|nr:YdeI/OmpD-associated family protein [Deltaproteobacteria bacterium]